MSAPAELVGAGAGDAATLDKVLTLALTLTLTLVLALGIPALTPATALTPLVVFVTAAAFKLLVLFLSACFSGKHTGQSFLLQCFQ